MNVSNFIFFDQSSTSNVSNPFGNASNGSALTLQVDDFGLGTSIDLSVTGSVDMEQPDSFFPLKVIALESFKTTKKITKPGIYLIIIDGIARVKMTSNTPVGGFKAYAVSIS